MAINNAQKEIIAAVSQWEGVAVQPHRFGGVEFVLGRREIGHIHGNALVDIPFPTGTRNKLIAERRAQPHHILPDSGWVSLPLREAGDVQRAIDLLRESYDIARRQKRSRNAETAPRSAEA